MADAEQYRVLMQGVAAWNPWRRERPELQPDLVGADLAGADLQGLDLHEALLWGADLQGARTRAANLEGAELDANAAAASLQPPGILRT